MITTMSKSHSTKMQENATQ